MAKGNKNPIPVTERLTSKESMFFPSLPESKWKTLDPDIRWDLKDIINHIFPAKYQAKSNEHATLLLDYILQHPEGIRKDGISSFLKNNKIPEATAYNVVIPKMVKFGLIERKREVNPSNPSKGWFMILKPSLTFSTALDKLAKEWRSHYKTAMAKKSNEN